VHFIVVGEIVATADDVSLSYRQLNQVATGLFEHITTMIEGEMHVTSPPCRPERLAAS
jgi:hypothetical protein